MAITIIKPQRDVDAFEPSCQMFCPRPGLVEWTW